jgi:outer membrane biosynthesis protein TonB
VETRQILRSGITASAIAHLSFLMLVIVFTEVHPFGSVTAEPIAVDIVTPDEVAEKAPEPPPTSKPDKSDSFDLFSTTTSGGASPAATQSPSAAQSPAGPQQTAAKSSQTTTPPQKQAALSQPKPAPSSVPSLAPSAALGSMSNPPPTPASTSEPRTSEPNPTSSPTSIPALAADPQPSSASTTQSLTPAPAYTPPQPDLSVKYHVMLGLPVDLRQGKSSDAFDAPATEKVDVASGPIAEFRRQIKTCSALPKEVAASDKVAIKLRVMMRPDGRLAADPQLIEGTASMKGALLMKNAISALQSCQPYAMLPSDKYNEWKVLDLSFTPQDFGGAS